MPFGDYDHKEIMGKVKERCQSGCTARHAIAKKDKELELNKLEHSISKSKLKRHEDIEKRRLAGLQKAQKARKKPKGGK